MEVRQLRHVLALVEQGSFRRAAEVLHLSQPALTKSIQQLERSCGVRLFDRHGKSVVPTVFGELVARTARQVIDTLDGLLRAIDQTANLDAGELSIGAGPYAAEMWLGQVVGRVLKQHPRLRFKLHVEHWRTLPDLLRQGRIDLYVANVEEVLGRKEFRVIELPHVRGVWVCRAGHPLARRKVLRRSALREYPLIGPQIPEPIRNRLESGPTELSMLDRKIDTTSVTMMKAMIREGDAISLVHPDMVRAELASGEFTLLEIEAPPLSLKGGVVWLAERSPSPAALAFLRELLTEVGLDPTHCCDNPSLIGRPWSFLEFNVPGMPIT